MSEPALQISTTSKPYVSVEYLSKGRIPVEKLPQPTVWLRYHNLAMR